MIEFRADGECGMERTYICIDLKSYYASVECVARGLDPLRANLLVADESRTDQTICLAVSPALKAKGLPGRPRLFEAKQKIKEYEMRQNTKLEYVIAAPRMAEYERISAQIYGIYLRYIAPEDIHIYSIDECFLDCTGYLHAYQDEAERLGINSARAMAMTMIQDVLKETGITATVGIGTNLYLAKVAMDIVAKKSPADENGVRIAELNEDSYKFLLWSHRPLTDFWQIGRGKAKRLEKAFIFTMGDIAARTQWDEEYFYKTFGVDAEILIDHAWGIEPVTMRDIKSYKTAAHSVSSGQVLPRPYTYPEARLILSEMTDGLCADLYAKCLTSRHYSWWAVYDHRSMEACPEYDGPVSVDFYGRLHPKHTGGVVKLISATNASRSVGAPMLQSFDTKADHRLLFRKLTVCANEVAEEDSVMQLSVFTDFQRQERERRLQGAMHEVRKKFGADALFKGISLLDGMTARERSKQIGGHKA